MQNTRQALSFTFIETARARALIEPLPGSLATRSRIMRHMLALSLLALSISWTGHPAAQGITLVVCEGAEAQGSGTEIAGRYKDFAKRISTVLKRPVTVLPVTRLPALRQAMDEGRVDLAWIRPANFTADAIANRGYALVASAEGEFYSAF